MLRLPLLLVVLVVGGLGAAAAWAGEGAASVGPAALLPPLVAVALALTTKKVEPSLFTGVVVGALVAAWPDPLAAADGLATYAAAAVGFDLSGDTTTFDSGHLEVTVFSLLVAATVGVVSRGGGTRALVRRVEGVAKDARGAGVASWLAGGIVFFDDYANCLVVGNAMGPLCDRFGVSRAKLAYIVDSTAAPVASLALVSTWVGYEVGLIQDALQTVGSELSALNVYVASLPYRFYSLFTLAFVGMMAWSCRDFGPMREREIEARGRARTAPSDAGSAAVGSIWLGIVPIAALVLVTMAVLYLGGLHALGDAAADAALFEVLGEANPFRAMLIGSAVGYALAVVLGMRTLALKQLWTASLHSGGAVGKALVVLYLAWMLGSAIQATGASSYLIGLLGEAVPAAALPTVTFLLAAAIAFATGTSWGTMGILFPLVVPMAVTLEGPMPGPVLLGTTAAVLAGACFGDHTSPISDTTVLSSLGAGVDVVTHVRTQLPYALATGAVAVAAGYVPAGLGVSPWLLLPIGVLVLAAGLFFIEPVPPTVEQQPRT